jgi:hypothetical protein
MPPHRFLPRIYPPGERLWSLCPFVPTYTPSNPWEGKGSGFPTQHPHFFSSIFSASSHFLLPFYR